MEKTLKELAAELLEARSACAEIREAAQQYLDAVGTAKEADAKKVLIAEAKEDIIPIDGLLAFAGSEKAAQIFGEEGAKNFLAHAQEIKAAGAVYCDCPACAACEAVLKFE